MIKVEYVTKESLIVTSNEHEQIWLNKMFEHGWEHYNTRVDNGAIYYFKKKNAVCPSVKHQ